MAASPIILAKGNNLVQYQGKRKFIDRIEGEQRIEEVEEI